MTSRVCIITVLILCSFRRNVYCTSEFHFEIFRFLKLELIPSGLSKIMKYDCIIDILKVSRTSCKKRIVLYIKHKIINGIEFLYKIYAIKIVAFVCFSEIKHHTNKRH